MLRGQRPVRSSRAAPPPSLRLEAASGVSGSPEPLTRRPRTFPTPTQPLGKGTRVVRGRGGKPGPRAGGGRESGRDRVGSGGLIPGPSRRARSALALSRCLGAVSAVRKTELLEGSTPSARRRVTQSRCLINE